MKAIPPVVITLKKFSQEVELVAAGDLHWSSAESAHDFWWRMFDEHPNALYIFMGDLLNSISMADTRFGNTALRPEFYRYETLANVIEEEVYDFTEKMKKKLGEDWIRGHVIGCISGNHPTSSVFRKLGYDPHDLMCRLLGINNLGYSCMFPIRIRYQGGWSRDVMVFAHHGFGRGSRTEGGNITSLSRHAMQFDARICIYGHVHELVVKDLPPRIIYRPGTDPWITAEGRLLVFSGTFQRTFSHSVYPSYAELKGFPARPIGYALVKMKVRERKRGKGRAKDRYIRLEGMARSFYE